MGNIDQKTIKLSCSNCSIEESLKALDKGDRFGSYWTNFSDSEFFKITEEQNKKYGPSIKSAVCKNCGLDVKN